MKIIKKIFCLGLFLIYCSFLLGQESTQDSLFLEIKDINIYEPESVLPEINPDVYAVRALDSYNAMEYETAAKYFIKLLQYNNTDANALYNLACCYGLLGKDSLAVKFLQRAYDAGFTDLEHIQNDPDFDGVRESNLYIALMDTLDTIHEKTESTRGILTFIPSTILQKCRIKFPKNYDPNQNYPLVIGLHGWGDNVDNFIMLDGKFPEMNFIFAVPEAPYGFEVGTDIGYSWIEGWEQPEIFEKSVNLTEKYILSVIDYLSSVYNISDIYLTGFSQGCWMTYYVGLKNHQLFSGLLCFSGELPIDLLSKETISAAKELPVFIVHGENDRVIPLEAAQDSYSILKENEFRCELFTFSGAHEVPEKGFLKGFTWLGILH